MGTTDSKQEDTLQKRMKVIQFTYHKREVV